MTWLELIGKILLVGGVSILIVVVVIVVAVVLWLAYEQANGRNPFQ